MRTTLNLVFISSALIGITGCHSVTVPLSTDASGNVTTKPECLWLHDSQGTVTVKWKSSNESDQWLVHFLGETPCGTNRVMQNGMGISTCVINVPKMHPVYKYNALVGPNHEDPGIAHDTNDLHNQDQACPAPAKPRTPQTQGTVFCVDITSGSPVLCGGGDAKQLPVSAQDDIFFRGTGTWTITMGQGACHQTEISSAHSYCTVTGTADGSPYSYTISRNGGQPTGPYQLKVK